ncbi:MAG: DinB family protein [Bacteroidetes bacterium]|nr:MAG: DinB family protein [Bacteroidota bacterium]
MRIHTIDEFLDYYRKVRGRTSRVAALIPEGQIEWTYKPGKFTLGDLVRHIAAIERWLYVETALGRPARYAGCGTVLASGKTDVLAYLDTLHQESLELLHTLTPDHLQQKIHTPSGHPVTCWKWLRLLAEHEIHHRGQLYLYLNMLGIATPPLYGLTAEDVQALSRQAL